jgi:hypothetical protein
MDYFIQSDLVDVRRVPDRGRGGRVCLRDVRLFLELSSNECW